MERTYLQVVNIEVTELKMLSSIVKRHCKVKEEDIQDNVIVNEVKSETAFYSFIIIFSNFYS